MKILMLCPLLGSSSMITVYPMAKALSKKHEVVLVGPLMRKRPYINDGSLNVRPVEPPLRRPVQLAMMSLYRRNLSMLKKESFDVVHAFKMLPHTGPVAAKIKEIKGCKFALSLDDYDAAASRNPLKRAVMGWAGKSFKSADAITVSSTFLQNLYGGEVLYQVANESAFLGARVDAGEVKKSMGIEGKMVLYAGSFYRHKGIDVLIRAVQSFGDVSLVLAGSGPEEARLRGIAGKNIIFTGEIPMGDVARLTAACDMYAIPTIDTEYARAEIPGKIFEPMMLGKPIIASNISDIPEILDNGRCGIMTEPGNANQISEAISRITSEPAEAGRMGRHARERYFERYCMKHYEGRVNNIYRKLEGSE